MAAKFPWREYKTFADVGCAQGGTPVTIAEAHPAPERHRRRSAGRPAGV
jgi:hypothetical protein